MSNYSRKIPSFLFSFKFKKRSKLRWKIVGINLFYIIYFRSTCLRKKKKKEEKEHSEIRVISHEGEIKNASDGILALGSGSLTPASDEPTSKNRRPDVKLYSEPDTGAVHRLLNPSSTKEEEQRNSQSLGPAYRYRRSIRKRNLDSKEIYYEKSCKIWNVVKLYVYIYIYSWREILNFKFSTFLD